MNKSTMFNNFNDNIIQQSHKEQKEEDNDSQIQQLKSRLLILVQTKQCIKDFEDIFHAISQYLFHSIRTKRLETNSIGDIVSIIIQITSQEITMKNFTPNLQSYFSLLERLMILFFFHFNHSIIHLGLLIEKFLVELLPTQYHKQLLQNIIKILQIANIKRTINGIISQVIIINLSSALLLLIKLATSQDVKKLFYEFIKQNYNEYDLLYSFTLLTNDDLNFSSLFTNEFCFELLDRFKGDFEKKLKLIEGLVTRYDNTLSSMNQLKQGIEKISQLCKIIDAFTTRNHRTYNIDKTLKNLLPKAKTFLMILIKPITLELKLSSETIQNIISFTRILDAFDLSNILQLLNWNQQLLAKNPKYISNTELVIRIISENSYLPNDSIGQVTEMICQIVDNYVNINTVLVKENISIKYYLIRILLNLRRIKPNYVIDDSYTFALGFYNEIQGSNGPKKKMKDDIGNMKDYEKDNVEYYSKVYEESMNKAKGIKKQYDKVYMMQCIGKFEEFKNSMKQIYDLNNALDIDNQVNDFKNKINNNSIIQIEDFEKFFVESSIEMYQQIFQANSS